MQDRLVLDQSTARQVVLAQAIELGDTEGKLVGAAERDAIEREAAEATRDGSGQAPPARAYLVERARRLLVLAGKRNSRLARLAETEPWTGAVAWLLPLLAFVVGASLDRLGDPSKLDLLSPPLLLFIFWNLAVYLMLLAAALLPQREPAAAARMAGWLHSRRVGGGAVARQFGALWWQVAGPMEGWRVKQLLHASAAAWAIGVALSIAAGGIVRDYRVGWESLWLGPADVHLILRFLFAPVQAVFGVEGLTLQEIERLQAGSGVAVGQQEARKWVKLFLGLLALAVIVPRLLLAGYAAARRRLAAASVALDLQNAYFVEAMGRVSPASVRIGWTAQDDTARALMATVILQCGAADGALRTARDDELRFIEGAATDADMHWQITAQTVTLGDKRLPVESCAACWPLEHVLRDALLAAVAGYKKPGAERLMQAWHDTHRARLEQSMQLLGGFLADAAADSQEVPMGSMSGLLTAEGRAARRRASEEAMESLLARIDSALTRAALQLLALHGLQEAVSAGRLAPSAMQVAATLPLDSTRAGAAGAMAGVAAGALAGAKLDLLTGGLTMGAGAALGALIGGSGAFGAARWLNATSWRGTPVVRLSDEQLQTLAEHLMVRYLGVIHAGRMKLDVDPWRSDVVAALANREESLGAVWTAARAGRIDEARATSVPELREAACALVGSLYPGAQLD